MEYNLYLWQILKSVVAAAILKFMWWSKYLSLLKVYKLRVTFCVSIGFVHIVKRNLTLDATAQYKAIFHLVYGEDILKVVHASISSENINSAIKLLILFN